MLMAYDTKKHLKKELPEGFQKVDLKIIHKRLIETMQVLVKICNKHNIKIYPAWGSLLGFKRHDKKMIPWDDDIDLAISYWDREKFIKAIQLEHNKDFKSANDVWPGTYGFGFVSNDRKVITSGYFNTGNFSNYSIDVFEIARFRKKSHERKIRRLIGILWVRDSQGGGIQKLARGILKLIPRKIFANKMFKYREKYLDKNGEFESILVDDSKGVWKPSYLNSSNNTSYFEGVKLSIPDNIEDILKVKYKDWEVKPSDKEISLSTHFFGEEIKK